MKLAFKVLLVPVILAIFVRFALKYEIFGTKFSVIFPMFIYTHVYLAFTQPIGKNQPVTWRPGNFRTKGTPNAEMPNVLLILVDDFGFNDVSGGCGVATPNMDSIRRNGISFTQAYSGHATCAPSRAALLTGRFPTRFGSEFTPGGKGIAEILTMPKPHDIYKPFLHEDLLDQLPPMSKMVVPLNETLFSTVLQEGGYDTYHIGKWDCGPGKGYTALARGFNETLSFDLGGAPYLEPGDPDLVNGYGNEFDDFVRWVLRFHIDHNDGPFFKPDKYMTDYLSEHAANLIKTRTVKRGEKQQMDPFFLDLSYNAPHNPYQALRSDYEDPEVQKLPNLMARVYAAMIKSLDRGIGQVLQALKDANVYENTIVIFTSDNGGANYAGLPTTNHPFRGWKGSLFEGGIHVPMYMQWPAVIKPPTDCTWDELKIVAGQKACEQMEIDSPVAHVDFFTSLASLTRNTEEARQKPLANGVHLDGINIFDLVYAAVDKRNQEQAQTVQSKSTDVLDPTAGAVSNEIVSDAEHTAKLQQALTEEKSRTRTLYWRSGHYMAVRVGDWKLQIADRPDKVWFYHLKTDPHEWRNLALQVNVTTKASLKNMLRHLPPATDEEIQAYGHAEHDEIEHFQDFIAQHLRRVYFALSDMDAAQAPPAWPAASETPCMVDKDVNQKQELGDEYVYWAN